jgi:hypothetical protein
MDSENEANRLSHVERSEMMPTYLLSYHGGSIPKTEAENAELMTKWLEWMDSLGVALEANNNPVTATRTIHSGGTVSDDGGANPVAGLSFITVDTLKLAVRSRSLNSSR